MENLRHFAKVGAVAWALALSGCGIKTDITRAKIEKILECASKRSNSYRVTKDDYGESTEFQINIDLTDHPTEFTNTILTIRETKFMFIKNTSLYIFDLDNGSTTFIDDENADGTINIFFDDWEAKLINNKNKRGERISVEELPHYIKDLYEQTIAEATERICDTTEKTQSSAGGKK